MRPYWLMWAVALGASECQSGWQVGVVQQESIQQWDWSEVHFVDPNIFFKGNGEEDYAFFKRLEPETQFATLEEMVAQGWIEKSAISTQQPASIEQEEGETVVYLGYSRYKVIEPALLQPGHHGEIFCSAVREGVSSALSSELGAVALPTYGFKSKRHHSRVELLGPSVIGGYYAYPRTWIAFRTEWTVWHDPRKSFCITLEFRTDA